jgi:Holliday junction DNA helicase RuvA
MIGHLEGKVLAARAGSVILSVNGVGYKIATTRETAASIKGKKEAALWTHLAVREDALDLYGFADEEALIFFELLLTVPGIGPKSALAVLDIASIGTLRNAVTAGNASYLTNVSGIGKKTAAKIILELKDKVGKSDEKGVSLSDDEEALQAMRALGYTQSEARDALRKVPAHIERASERLREALKVLGSR